MISRDFKRRLIIEGIDPKNVLKISTKNNKNKGQIITEITLIDNSKHVIIDDFIYYAARKKRNYGRE